ncbi:hypothetical protein DP107_07085 [Haloglomus irregulare]|jgi:hypothetical protein|uniref:Uncharacterized protein n=1 Tax=Haloglomus irregulare TaxID=2234134 RepID=A0A554NBH3_9EURY|nr:hypothetical protein [Haloglomus irregulare]TSD14733.1 hypothetical protein DP107_07085 [Haloglomus irregulare]
MDRDEILAQLTQDVLSYVMQGGFPESEVARSIRPAGLDERFAEYESLLDLHFVLKGGVVEFVRELDSRLRAVRTETERVSRTRRGTVDGRIDWAATTKRRYSGNPHDRSLFVCENRSEDYDIPENVVLKRLLSVVYTTLEAAEEYLNGDYEWVRETWKGDEQLIADLRRVMERNVHVRRIRDPESYEPTERMLTAAETARQPVYREAAALLRTRDRVFDGDEAEIRSLLDETAVTPDDDNTLFELFVLFRFVAVLERLEDGQVQFETISSGRQEVARLDGDREIVLYHDNSAADRDLSFLAEPESGPDEASRTERVQQVALDVANGYFQDRSFRNHTGRPDVIVLEIRDEDADEREYLVAEVKNSTRTDTIRRGIKETLEYLAFLRVNEELVFEGDYFGTGWNGVLVVQDLDEPTANVDEQADREIKILQASEIESRLGAVLSEIL